MNFSPEAVRAVRWYTDAIRSGIANEGTARAYLAALLAGVHRDELAVLRSEAEAVHGPFGFPSSSNGSIPQACSSLLRAWNTASPAERAKATADENLRFALRSVLAQWPASREMRP